MTVKRSQRFLLITFGCLLLVNLGDMRLRCHYGESVAKEVIIRDRVVTCSTVLSKYCFKLQIPTTTSDGTQAWKVFRGCNGDAKHGRMANSSEVVDDCKEDGCEDYAGYPGKSICCCSESKCNE
ncbi:hypothetical protein AAVH_34324 [Aphelenchoides avenae]|nr:hypothetical protein AAVH_34324 [Aphelenchus avenae]